MKRWAAFWRDTSSRRRASTAPPPISSTRGSATWCRRTCSSTSASAGASTPPTPTGTPAWAPPSAGEAAPSSVALARLEDDQLAGDAVVAEGLAELLRRAGEGRERPPVNGDHLAHAEVAAGAGGLAGVHGEQVADGQEGQLGPVHLAEELHVREQGGVAGMIEGVAARQPDDVARGRAAVEDLVAVADAAGVVGTHHGHLQAQHVLAAAEVHGGAALDPLALQPLTGLEVGHHRLRLVLFAQRHRVADVVEVGVRDEDGVEAVELFQGLGTGGVALDPGIDQHHLASRQLAADRGVADIRELRTRMVAHGLSLPSCTADSNRAGGRKR